MPCPPRMVGCRRDCLHRRMVEDYRAARERDERRRDEYAIGYPADERLYAAQHRMVTLRAWLVQLAGSGTYARVQPQDEAVV